MMANTHPWSVMSEPDRFRRHKDQRASRSRDLHLVLDFTAGVAGELC